MTEVATSIDGAHDKPDVPVVAIGASAGGLESLERFFLESPGRHRAWRSSSSSTCRRISRA